MTNEWFFVLVYLYIKWIELNKKIYLVKIFEMNHKVIFLKLFSYKYFTQNDASFPCVFQEKRIDCNFLCGKHWYLYLEHCILRLIIFLCTRFNLFNCMQRNFCIYVNCIVKIASRKARMNLLYSGSTLWR